MSANLYKKQNVNYNEYFIHQWTYDLLKNLSKKDTNINIHVPKIISYDPRSKTLTMQKIYGDNLSNIYGEDIKDVPIKLVKIIRQLLTLLSQYLIDYIDITGGEPMLHPDIVEIIKYIRNVGMNCCMITNALAGEQKTQEVIDAGIDEFLVSIHGTENTHNDIVQLPGAREKQIRFLDQVTK